MTSYCGSLTYFDESYLSECKMIKKDSRYILSGWYEQDGEKVDFNFKSPDKIHFAGKYYYGKKLGGTTQLRRFYNQKKKGFVLVGQWREGVDIGTWLFEFYPKKTCL